MAINIGATTTWQTLMTRIRRAAGVVSEQESGLIDVQLRDLIYRALLDVRNEAAGALDNFYIRPDAVTLSAISSGVSTGSIAATSTLFNIATLDFSKVNLTMTITSVFVSVPILNHILYNQYKKSYTAAQIGTTSAIATIYLAAGTPNVLTIEAYTGASGTPATPKLWYPKNPAVWAADADTVDMPDNFLTFVDDRVVKMISAMPNVKRTAPVIQGQ